MLFKETFEASGHKNIKSTHPTTIEFTKESNLSLRGNCIIGVSATKGFMDFSKEIRSAIKDDRSSIKLILQIENLVETITGFGHSKLTLSNPNDIVCRKSSFICDRTLMINCDKSAKDLDKNFIEKLSEENCRIKIKLIVNL